MAFSPDKAISLIRTAWGNQRLAHALLLSGPHTADLHTVAIRTACLVNSWAPVDSLDGLRLKGALVLEPESKLRRIKIDAVREVIRTLQFSSADGGMKIVILNGADRLTVEATNAFLKTLEEPPPDTLILLLTRAPEQLLDTVRSRCLLLPLHRPDSGGMELSPPQARLLESLTECFSAGRPVGTSRALGLLGDFQRILSSLREEIEADHHDALKEETEHYQRSTDGVWLRNRREYYDDLTESACAEQRNHLVSLLFIWLGEILRRRHGLDALDLPGCADATAQAAAVMTDHDLHRRLRAVDEMRKNLSTNVREVLALEVGFLHAFG
ncbi:MAG: dna polymerase iii delta subunit [Verrucomicrobiales bacterium]|nr:dna polymerase iii delta subunit [Verrucomicrobiales bacterium]